MQALCGYALKLTRHPAALSEADLEPLRAVALDDRAIVDANQVVSYFNYVNRIADGLGVELEAQWPPEQRAERQYLLGRGALPLVSPGELPWLTVAQMREVDRLMTQEIGITLEQMMENAGRALATAATWLLHGARGRSIVVLAGPGGNGGGGMVAARHLLDAGADVEVALATDRLTGTPRRQLKILRALGLEPHLGPLGDRDPDLVLDALLGYSQNGPPRGRAEELIRWASGRRTFSLDVPSGLELQTGTLHAPHVTAEETVTLALPKQGLKGPEAAGAVGRLLLADIGVPAIVYERLGVSHRTPFGEGALVEVVRNGIAG
jgi:NAD(P)H-hydrate epimerase